MFALTSGQTMRDPEEGRAGGRNTTRTGSCIMYRTEYSRYWTPRNIYWPLERRYTPPVPAFIEVRKLAATVRSREQLSRREDASRGIVQRCSSYNSAGIIIIVNRRGQEMESKNPGVGMFAIQRDRYVWGLSYVVFNGVEDACHCCPRNCCGFLTLTLPVFYVRRTRKRGSWKNAK